ncbi:MAG: energy-coupling factor ABC transporter ATP-binding protein, partial [Candidatus Ranarchaeia archaeon]
TELSHFLKKQGVFEGKYPVTLKEGVEQYRQLLAAKRISVDNKWLENRKTLKRNEKVLLDVKGLRHVYPPDIEALKGIDLDVRKGDFVAIIGQNGAGKTTLVKHFLNLLQPTEGNVTYSGYDCSILTVADLARHIGLVLQNPDHQLFESSVYKEIIYGPRNLLKANKEELEKRVKKAMDTLNIAHLADKHPLSLSWGDRQKVAVAAVLAMEPRIIIFDEPTTGMDYLGRHDIMQLAQDLNRKGHTIITISHDMELLAEYSNWTVVMGEGEILYQGPTYEAFSRLDVLAKTFLKPPQITMLSAELKDMGFPQGILTVREFCAAIGYPMPENYGRENLIKNRTEGSE